MICAITGKEYKMYPDTTEDFVKDYVTVTSGLSGHFAVHIWFNEEGFYEPYESGIGRYATKEEAIVEAKAMAEMAEMPCLIE